MFATLIAFLGSWVGIFVILAVAAVAWLLLKAMADLVAWFRDEILDDPVRRSRRARGQRNRQQRVSHCQLAAGDPDNGREAKRQADRKAGG